MDVSKDRFAHDIVKIIQDVANSHFIAFDLEFSGVAGRTARTGKPTLEEYYQEVKEAAEKYEVLQIGLTIVEEDTFTKQYKIKPYNFNITQTTPLHERYFKRVWSMNSGAIGFLLRNRFDFGAQIAHGVHYLSRMEESQVRDSMHEPDTLKRPDMVLKAEDESLVKHIRSSVTEWLQEPECSREKFLNIPSESKGKRVPGTLNRYQMRLTHQIVQSEYPGLKTASMYHFVQITNPTEEERKDSSALMEQYVDREVGRAIGFRWLLEAIIGGDIRKMPEDYLLPAIPKDVPPEKSEEAVKELAAVLNKKLRERRRVLIGHNCFTDLVNIHRFITGALPDNVSDFADSIQELFPAIIDTKHLASNGSARWGDTSLARVAEDLGRELIPTVDSPPSFDRYTANACQHEAGYDSLLTALIAIKLSAKMHREDAPPSQVPQSGHESSGMTPFGEEEGYVTATESMSEASVAIDGQKIPQTPVPVTAVKINFDLGQAQTSGSDVRARNMSNPQSEVVAVKDAASKLSQLALEVAKIRRENARSNFYALLPDEGENARPGEAGDLIDFDSEPVQSDTEKNTIAQSLPNKGEMMPSWDDEFWRTFGNKLQVNGCKEGICQL